MKAFFSGKSISVKDAALASGGEGKVCETSDPAYIAKIYHDEQKVPVEKLEAMMEINSQGADVRVAAAWPLALVYDKKGVCRGFLMLRIQDSVILQSVCIPKARKRISTRFSWRYLHAAAHNYALAIGKLHGKGCVVGDIRTTNAMIDSQARICLIDADSFQIRDTRSGRVHNCPVASEGYTPPELIESENFRRVRRTPLHDQFGMGIVIFYLLFGCHPFQGVWQEGGEPPGIDNLVLNGDWLYASDSRIKPGPFSIPLSVLHPALEECFHRCFTLGHNVPESRPTPSEWADALSLAFQSLVQCPHNPNHYHLNGTDCFWCSRLQATGRDDFPENLVTPRIAESFWVKFWRFLTS